MHDDHAMLDVVQPDLDVRVVCGVGICMVALAWYVRLRWQMGATCRG